MPRAGPLSSLGLGELRHALAEGVAVVRVPAVLLAERAGAQLGALRLAGLGRVQGVLARLVRACLRLRGDALAEGVPVVRAGSVVLGERLAVMRGREVRIGLLCAARGAGADPVLVLGSRPLGDALAEGVPAVALHRAVRLAEELRAQLGAEGATGAGRVLTVLPRRAAAERRRRDDQGREDRDEQEFLHVGKPPRRCAGE